MTMVSRILVYLACLGALLWAGCSPALARTQPTLSPSITEVKASTPSPAPSFTVTFTPTASLTSTPLLLTATLPPPAHLTATPCAPELCVVSAQFFLSPPIPPTYNDRIDVTYRFGSTQGGLREAHHGVEFLNGYGTPVLAAAEGTVIVAGDDRQPISPPGAWPILFYGPYSYFYGNLVVIEHTLPTALRESFPNLPDKLFTLYGHLSKVLVSPGERVQRGQMIGEVGMSGIATGSHLHFEVRLGENSYASVRNPELWLVPHQDENGVLFGAIAGRILSAYGEVRPDSGIVLEHLPNGSDAPRDFQVQVLTYEEKALIGQPPFYESFAVGELPPGLYRLSFPYFGVQKFYLEVLPGALTIIHIRVEG